MSAREWKPGDVIAWRVDDETYNSRADIAALMDELIAWWPRRPRAEVGIRAGTSALLLVRRMMCDARVGPLAVIDPESPEDRDAVAKALVEAMYKAGDGRSAAIGVHPATVGVALREFADPKPRIEEPTGWGAVVEDDTGAYWTLYAPEVGVWINYREGKRRWHEINPFRIVGEGVTS